MKLPVIRHIQRNNSTIQIENCIEVLESYSEYNRITERYRKNWKLKHRQSKGQTPEQMGDLTDQEQAPREGLEICPKMAQNA